VSFIEYVKTSLFGNIFNSLSDSLSQLLCSLNFVKFKFELGHFLIKFIFCIISFLSKDIAYFVLYNVGFVSLLYFDAISLRKILIVSILYISESIINLFLLSK